MQKRIATSNFLHSGFELKPCVYRYLLNAMINFKRLFSNLKNEERKIYLCLSGGGVRAIAFHTGVLKYLAQNEMFKRIDSISSVSAGSLLTGFIFSKNGLHWPKDQSFLDGTIPSIKEIILSGGLLKKMKDITFEPNIDSWMNRANRLYSCIKEVWGIRQKMGDVFCSPVGQSIRLVLKQERDFIFLGKILSDTDMVDLMRVTFASPTLLQCQVLCPFTLVHMSQKTSEFDWNYSMDEVDPAEDNIQKNLNKYISSLEAFMIIQV